MSRNTPNSPYNYAYYAYGYIKMGRSNCHCELSVFAGVSVFLGFSNPCVCKIITKIPSNMRSFVGIQLVCGVVENVGILGPNLNFGVKITYFVFIFNILIFGACVNVCVCLFKQTVFCCCVVLLVFRFANREFPVDFCHLQYTFFHSFFNHFVHNKQDAEYFCIVCKQIRSGVFLRGASSSALIVRFHILAARRPFAFSISSSIDILYVYTEIISPDLCV